MERLTIEVRSADIEGSQKYGLDDPVLVALQRITGTLWRMSEYGVALEIMAPARVLFLRGGTLERWRTYQTTRTMMPFEFVAEFKTGSKPPDFPTLTLDTASLPNYNQPYPQLRAPLKN